MSTLELKASDAVASANPSNRKIARLHYHLVIRDRSVGGTPRRYLRDNRNSGR